MKIINLLINLFSIIKTKALECVSVVNQKCMPRPKILDVNEGIGEALFFPYKVLVNKCSGSCNTLDNPMSKICVPKIVKNVNMQVYNFLMRLNETRNVLWHESCKCICKLSSSVCNNKQIWNDDTCRCDCNEDFAGIINCAKGYMWNPSTCESQCDKWCKQGQYLDHKNCVCKNKLIGRVIEECTSVINETMINNYKDNITNNTYLILFIVFLIGFIVFLMGFIYYCRRSSFDRKKLRDFIYLKTSIYEIIKMGIDSLEIKDKTNYDFDNICYIDDFDVNSLRITKKESRIGANIYYTRCTLNLDDDIVIPLHFLINRLIGFIEEIDGSNDKYLVVVSSLRNKNIINALDKVWSSIKDKINPSIKIKNYDKFRFNSDIDLPVNTIIELRSLLINVSCVIEKDNEYYPEIYLDDCSYVKNSIY